MLIDADIAEDPARYRAEYFSEWRDDLATFLNRELIDRAVDAAVTVRPPQPDMFYCSFCDPSGGQRDSFTCAVAHCGPDGMAVLDHLTEIKAPFNPEAATKQISEVLKEYRCYSTTADRYAAGWTVSAFSRHGIILEHSERDRSAIYLDALPMFASGKVRLLDNRRLVGQLAALERRTFPTGKDRVDHGASGADDAANAVCGALVGAANAAPRWPVITKEMLAMIGPDRRRPLVRGWS